MKDRKKNVQNVLSWRRRAKQRLVAAFGGKCGICGYDRCISNLVFHHIDPAEKTFSFGRFQSKAWAKIIAGVRKCVMLCANCHGEVHADMAEIYGCPRFDESFAVTDRKSV